MLYPTVAREVEDSLLAEYRFVKIARMKQELIVFGTSLCDDLPIGIDN
jgi:hypothetical protein